MTRLTFLTVGTLLTILALGPILTLMAILALLAFPTLRRSLLVFHDLRLWRVAGNQRVVAAPILAILVIVRTATLLVVVRIGRLLDTLVLLLGGLRHGVEDAEVMLCMLEVAFRHDTVPGTGRIAPELEILLEKLLCSAADAQIRSIAVEDMVAIERDLTVMMTYRGAAATATATAAATRTMVAASHAFHVHQSVAALS